MTKEICKKSINIKVWYDWKSKYKNCLKELSDVSSENYYLKKKLAEYNVEEKLKKENEILAKKLKTYEIVEEISQLKPEAIHGLIAKIKEIENKKKIRGYKNWADWNSVCMKLFEEDATVIKIKKWWRGLEKSHKCKLADELWNGINWERKLDICIREGGDVVKWERLT